LIEFEKDNDENSHVDFISSSANLRADNYNLANMDWLNVKLKAGKVILFLNKFFKFLIFKFF
jgi:hypothetical protein